MVEVFVGFGSNVEPETHLGEAHAELTRQFGSLRCSSVYRSPAFGFEGDDFLNLVGGFESELGPDAIDDILSRTEYAGGRSRGPVRFAPRTLDLDLLIYGPTVDPSRRLPREDVLFYPFVLAPLAEIVPGLRHPVTGQTLREAWLSMDAAGRHRCVRVGPVDRLG
jgi:2-amino-4-hydroxy-6-hydroxymethyldihydropteridine diphosphokinase